MKKNRLLVLSLLACTLLAGCDEENLVQNGSNPVGNVGAVDQNGGNINLDTQLTLQDLYETLKSNEGGSKAVEVLLDKITEYEYINTAETGKVTLKDSFSTDSFDVKTYHTNVAFLKEIAETFDDAIDGTLYVDNDGKFDAEEYKEHIENTYDLELTAGASKYLSDELNAKLVYNYDEYIEEELIPGILENYLYLDYVTASSKYKGQFSNQYAMKLEVLKVKRDTTKENGAWSTSLVNDLRKVTAKALNATGDVTFSDNYDFATFNSDNDLIIFDSEATGLTYTVYENNEHIDALVATMSTPDATTKNITQVTIDAAKAVAANSETIVSKTWTIDNATVAGQEYYEHIEELLIARDLYNIDRELVLARNYDFKTPKYDAMTETEKNEAKTFASTYSSANTKPMTLVVKEKKISAQQVSYYEEPEYYNKSTYTSVLPTALSSLRGTSAKDLKSNLLNERFLYPKKSSVSDPVYLDVESNYYYVCEVSEWYGLYVNNNMLDNESTYKSISNYQIEAYQKGEFKEYTLATEGESVKINESELIKYADNPAKFESVIELVQISFNNIVTDAMKKEAIVALFEKYGLEVHEEVVYNYINGQYPDYFEEDEEA